MTGAAPKTQFLNPRMAVPIVLETARLWWRQQTRRTAAAVAAP
jgi:hypothetical protein